MTTFTHHPRRLTQPLWVAAAAVTLFASVTLTVPPAHAAATPTGPVCVPVTTSSGQRTGELIGPAGEPDGPCMPPPLSGVTTLSPSAQRAAQVAHLAGLLSQGVVTPPTKPCQRGFGTLEPSGPCH